MTTKTIKIGIKQREVELRDVEQLDFDGYKNQICTYKKTEKYTPKRQQNLTQAQRTAKADVMRRTALSTNAKIKADARAYRETHGISEQHWWCETCHKAIKKDSIYTHNRSKRHFQIITNGAPATPRSKMTPEQLKEYYKNRYNKNKFIL
jgi:hypothetical protein